MKKLVSLVIVMALVMSLAVGAAAAGDDGSITIGNAVAGQKYHIYKVFDLTYTGDSVSYTFTRNDANTAFFDALNATGSPFKLTEIATNKFNVTTTASAKEITTFLTNQISNLGTAIELIGATSGATTQSNLAYGYYFVTSTVGSVVSIDSAKKDVTIDEKNTAPTLTKVVKNTTDTDFVESTTANIGETLNYKITIKAGKGAVNYVLTDVLPAGVTAPSADSVNVTGATPTSITVSSQTITVDFTGVTLDENTEIVITYTAALNASAVVAGTGNVNTATLTYGADATNKLTVSDTATVMTYQFGLYKTAKINNVDHTILSGAKFKMYDAETGGNEIKLIKDGAVYRPVIGAETAVEIEAGNVIISGLKNGTYYLEETIAPEGYNKLTSRESITITDANNIGNVTDNVYDATSGGGLEVINQAGTVLPSTGGMGTTIFYVLGGLMFVGALVLLVTNKRMKAE